MAYNPEHKHNFMAEGLMIPFANQTDANRMQMFNSHSGQMIQLSNAEFPLVFTGFENQIGKYSTGYKRNKGNSKLVVKKFVKNAYVYYLLVYDVVTKEYDIIERKESEVLTEYYASKFDNSVVDNLKEGDTIPEDQVYYHDCNYDEDLNFKYGKNINVAYLAYKGYTNEDAILISESAAKEMSSYFCQDVEVNINTNDVLLNLYGDETTYKTFPNIGESVREEDGILLSMRKVVYADIINKLKDDQLNKKLDGDINFYTNSHAKVIDLDIFSNVSMEKLEGEPYNQQILTELKKQKAFQDEVVEVLHPILTSKNVKFTNDLRDFYNRVAEYADPMTEFESGGRRFDNIILRFRLLWEKPLSVGSKITQRYGGKGVLARIVPDEEMPVLNDITLDGKRTRVRPDSQVNMRASVCINPQGVFNRLNPSQLTEQVLNYIMMITRYRMEEMEPVEAKDLLLSVIKDIDAKNEVQDNYNVYNEYLNSLDEEELAEVINHYIKHGVHIKQEPFFRNVNIFDLYDVAEKYGIEEGYDDRIDTKFIIAPIYYIRLKHESAGKFSAKSIDNNNMVDLPTKTKEKKNSTSPISNTPIKLGEMEVTDLGLIGSLSPVEQLLDQYANNAEARKELIYNLLTSNPYDLKTDMKPKQSIGNNNKVLNAYLMALGVKYDRNSEDVLRDLLLNLSGTEIDEIIDYLREEENPKKEDVLKFISDLNAKK